MNISRTAPATRFHVGDILVVPASSILHTIPTFFRVISKADSGTCYLRTLGSKLVDGGKKSYVPSDVEYYDSMCCYSYVTPAHGTQATECAFTGCGNAFVWNGEPC